MDNVSINSDQIIASVSDVDAPTDPLTLTLRGVNDFSFNFEGIISFLQTIFSIYTVFAYVLSLFLLYIFVYSSVRLNALRQEQKDELRRQEEAWVAKYKKPTQKTYMSKIKEYVESSNPNDWKSAIMEADILLDKTLKQNGFDGDSLGERLLSPTAKKLRTIDDAWTAHKVRNRIAHDGEDFVLTQRIARDTIYRYQNVFDEIGLM